eukprot:gene13599-19472_t
MNLANDGCRHVDFCSEVSTAARLSDGALVVVDAVEGVCIQTHAVLRQAWEEKVRPCLIVNKIDRLIIELRLTPMEAYQRLQSIVTHVNMIMSAYQSEKFISDADAILAVEDAVQAHDTTQGDGEPACSGPHAADIEEEDVFQPNNLCNVAFGSAYDGWAFRLDQFADMYAEKLGCKPEALTRTLWGDFAFAPKDKRVIAIGKKGPTNLKPMFVQFALEPIWKAYSVCTDKEDVGTVLGQIVKSRGLGQQVTARALEHPEPRQALRAVLGMTVNSLPSPVAAAPFRVPHLLSVRPGHLNGMKLPEDLARGLANTENCIATSCAAESAPCVVRPGEPAPANPTDEVFLAFGRVFSGVAREGQAVHVLSAAYSPQDPSSHSQPAVMSALYMMMGRALERLVEVPAGNVLAIAGLETCILKSATLCSTPLCRPLAPMVFQAAAIVKVAVEPAQASEMHKLVEGLRLLNRADPFVEVSVMDTGEHVIGAAGEVHLETCIKDLKERFAKIELSVSAPLVAFRETIYCPSEETAVSGAGRVPRVIEATTPNGVFTVRVRALPLPGSIASALDANSKVLHRVLVEGSGKEDEGAGDAAAGSSSGVEALKERLQGTAEDDEGRGLDLMKRAWLMGPKGCGPNILLSKGGSEPDSLFDVPATMVLKTTKHGASMLGKGATPTPAVAPTTGTNAYKDGDEELSVQLAQPRFKAINLGSQPRAAVLIGLAQASDLLQQGAGEAQLVGSGMEHVHSSIESGVRAGFQVATAFGPLCDEPMCDEPSLLPLTLGFQIATTPGPLCDEPMCDETMCDDPSLLPLTLGFQIATASGPLCDEPMWGVCFELEVRLILPDKQEEERKETELELQEDVYGPFSGQVMTAVGAACRRAVMEAEPRLVEAMYLCEVQTAAEALSGTYAVLGRRRSRILREEMREGSDVFMVHAYLPVESSFGLADEMRRRSSGAASASLMLSHWERLQVDPFFVPTTDEEREEWGEEVMNQSNLAKRLIDATRRRKGLPVEEKVVKAATKQRTLKRNV